MCAAMTVESSREDAGLSSPQTADNGDCREKASELGREADQREAIEGTATDGEDDEDRDFWVADGDCLTECRADDTSSDGAASAPPRRPASSHLGSKLRRGAGRFGDAARSAIVAETRALVKDAQELAFGIREGAQLTAQDTLDLKEKLVSSTRARVAAGGGLQGLLGRRRGSSGSNLAADVASEGDAIAGTTEPKASLAHSDSAATASSDEALQIPAAAVKPTPLRALSQGLVAQFGMTTDASPCAVRQNADCAEPGSLEPAIVEAPPGGDADSSLEVAGRHADGMLLTVMARTGHPVSPGLVEPSWATESVSLPETASPLTPTDALDRLLSGEADSDSDEDVDFARLEGSTTKEYPSPSGSVSTSASGSQPSTAPSTNAGQRVGALATVATAAARFKGLRKGWQVPFGGGALSAATAPQQGEALDDDMRIASQEAEQPPDEKGGPVDRVEVGEAYMTETESPHAVANATEAGTAGGARRLVTQVFSGGLLQHARSLGGTFVTASRAGAASGTPAVDAEGQGRDGRESRGSVQSDGEDSVFAIGSDDGSCSEDGGCRRASKSSDYSEPRTSSVLTDLGLTAAAVAAVPEESDEWEETEAEGADARSNQVSLGNTNASLESESSPTADLASESIRSPGDD